MKWPEWLYWFRHAQSEYNVLRGKKAEDPLYQEFVRSFDEDSTSAKTKALAVAIYERYSLDCGDYNTPITDEGEDQSFATGQKMPEIIEVPDVVFLSSYDRPAQTWKKIKEGWATRSDIDLANIKVVKEPRLREQDHGLAIIYNDWRVFQTLHPEQKILREKAGPYWYTYPQGENVPEVIERVRSWIGTLVRDYSEQKVLVVSHHLTLLSFLAAIQRWDDEEFIRWDEEKKPINCGLTTFRGNPDIGDNGRLELIRYNQKLY